MDNFDLRKYLVNNPLTEGYTPGSGWTSDFNYDDMLAHGLTLTADDSIEDLEKVAEDFTDVNYHREAAPLYDAIDAIKAGDRGGAKMYINKFHKAVQATLDQFAEFDTLGESKSWSEYYKTDLEVLSNDQVRDIAQTIADYFTSTDTELDLHYKVRMDDTDEMSFDLDVEEGPNTPGDDWKDKNGFSIGNYLGDYAGGSFLIRPGDNSYLVFNVAAGPEGSKHPVAKVSLDGKAEIIPWEG